ncbi:MAG TPA: DUF4432 family protein [Cyclobacteriaceae bacterium]|jgi:galactose mutarotase-like enzyme|nr:DUF4432 family protein [Cytophagales bacterium]HRF32685.1 DUF4432 family protein [Cyclobacteriaceae bacterium]
MSCTLTHTTIAGMQAFYLENNLLKVGVLAGRGCDIFEFKYKPKEIDFLLHLSKGIRNPQTDFSQVRNTATQFEDYYYGGWQVCLPNSPAFTYRGAALGQHGEVALIPWQVTDTTCSDEAVSIKLYTEPIRVPIRIEREMTIRKDTSELEIKERITNRGGTSLDIMWGQHIAFGLPFLEEGVSIETNALTLKTEPLMPDHHRFQRNLVYEWPQAKNKKGSVDDARFVPPKGKEQYSDLCYLEGYGKNAFYSIKNKVRNVGFGLMWNGELFKTLWMWHELNATKDFPWWGNCYTVALEPWTSPWTNDPLEAINRKEWLILEAGQKIETTLRAKAFEDNFNPIWL